MNVVDYVTSEIGHFRYKLYLPKKKPKSTRRQVVEIALILGYLVSIAFHKIKTRQTQHNEANTVVSNI